MFSSSIAGGVNLPWRVDRPPVVLSSNDDNVIIGRVGSGAVLANYTQFCGCHLLSLHSIEYCVRFGEQVGVLCRVQRREQIGVLYRVLWEVQDPILLKMTRGVYFFSAADFVYRLNTSVVICDVVFGSYRLRMQNGHGVSRAVFLRLRISSSIFGIILMLRMIRFRENFV